MIVVNNCCYIRWNCLFALCFYQTPLLLWYGFLNTIFLFTDSDFTRFFVDGNDIQTEGHWVFSDGSPMSFKPWDRNEPTRGTSQNCMLVLSDKYHDVPCAYLEKFICERDFTTTPWNLGFFVFGQKLKTQNKVAGIGKVHESVFVTSFARNISRSKICKHKQNLSARNKIRSYEIKNLFAWILKKGSLYACISFN
jgi:hypothetical protein